MRQKRRVSPPRMSGPLGRRRFIQTTTTLALGALLPSVYARRSWASYGPLVDMGHLSLPEGFTYRVLETRGDVMSDGHVVPALADGMGLFDPGDGTWVLMRNHEANAIETDGAYPGAPPPPEAYDAARYGGVTRLVVDATDLGRVSSNLVLTGTTRNCAGGVSPWGWLSCEETTEPGHGYTFLCDPSATSVAVPVRIDGYGRFNHEAACVDPATSIAYLTEDRTDSAVYRFLPSSTDAPFTGKLQALKVVGQDRFVTSAGLAVGDALAIEWVDVPNPTPSTDSVRADAHAAGALILSRGEGIWFAGGTVYICSTDGGPSASGQIFALSPSADRQGGTLTLVAQSTSTTVLDRPDNITVAPWGEIFMAEDGGGANFIRGITATGEIFDLASTTLSELAGICFSPDGRALFVNIQGPGLTIAITGPFQGAQSVDAGSDGRADAAPDASTLGDAAPDPARPGRRPATPPGLGKIPPQGSGGRANAPADAAPGGAAAGGFAGSTTSGGTPGAAGTPTMGSGGGSGGGAGSPQAPSSGSANAGADGGLGAGVTVDPAGCGCATVGADDSGGLAAIIVAAAMAGLSRRG